MYSKRALKVNPLLICANFQNLTLKLFSCAIVDHYTKLNIFAHIVTKFNICLIFAQIIKTRKNEC